MFYEWTYDHLKIFYGMVKTISNKLKKTLEYDFIWAFIGLSQK